MGREQSKEGLEKCLYLVMGSIDKGLAWVYKGVILTLYTTSNLNQNHGVAHEHCISLASEPQGSTDPEEDRPSLGELLSPQASHRVLYRPI